MTDVALGLHGRFHLSLLPNIKRLIHKISEDAINEGVGRNGSLPCVSVEDGN
jgi:hypothetical protein